jgi:hypothetical protein
MPVDGPATYRIAAQVNSGKKKDKEIHNSHREPELQQAAAHCEDP